MPKLFSFLKRNRDKKTRQHEILSSIEGILSSIEGIYEVLAENDSLHYLNWIEQIKAEVLNLKKMARNLIGDNYVDSSRMLPKSVDQITEHWCVCIDDFTDNDHEITPRVQNLIGENNVDSRRVLPRCVEQNYYTYIDEVTDNDHEITPGVQNLIGENNVYSSRIQSRCVGQKTKNYEHIYETIYLRDDCASFAADNKVKTLQKSTDVDSTVSSTDIGTKRQTESNISTNFSRIDNISRPITECQSGRIFSETYSKLPLYSDVLRQDTDIDSISRTSIDTLPSTNSDSSGYNSDSFSKSREFEVIGDPLQTYHQSYDFNKPYVDLHPYPAYQRSLSNQQNNQENTDSCLVDLKTFYFCHKNTDTVSCFNSDTISCASSGCVSDFTSEDYGSPFESKDIKVFDTSDPLRTSLNQSAEDFNKPYVDLHPYPADQRSVSNQQNNQENTDSCLVDLKTFYFCHKNTDTVSCFNSDTISCASSGCVSDFTSEDYGSPSESIDIKVIDSSDPLQTSLNQSSNDFNKPYVDLHPYPADYRSVSNQQNSQENTDSCLDPKTFDSCHKNTVLQYNNNYFNGAPQCDKFQFLLMPPIQCQSEPNSEIYDDVDVDVDVETNDNKKLLWNFETSNDQSIAGFMNTITGEPSNFCGSRHDSFQNVVFDQSQTNCANWHDILPSTFPDDRAIINDVGNEHFSMHENEVETHQDSPVQQDQLNSNTNNNNNTIISNTKNSGRLLTPNQRKKNRQKSNSGYYQRKKLTMKQLTDKEGKFTKINRDLKAKKTELFQSKTFKLLRSLKLYYPHRYNKILPELRKQVDLELECEKQERRWIV